MITCSGPNDVPTVVVHYLDNNETYTWVENRNLRAMIAKQSLPLRKDLVIESNGFNARVRLLLPPNFDPNKKYPLLLNV